MNSHQRDFARPRLRSHWRARLYRTTRQWPILVWIAGCVLCAYLHHKSPHPESDVLINGTVDPEAVSISPVETARIKSIHVTPGQRVNKGDVLVDMDTALVAHGSTADMLDAIGIESSFGDTHQDLLQAISQRYDIVADLEGDIAFCRQEWERELAERDALREEQARRQKLHQNRVIDSLTLNELRPALAAVEKAVVAYPLRISLYEKQLENAKALQKGIMDWLQMKEGDTISDAISRRLDEKNVFSIVAQAKSEAALLTMAYKLIAPKDGVVSEILCQEGEVIASDIPILRIVTTAPKFIQVNLGENQVSSIQPGEKYVVHSLYRHTPALVMAQVEYVSPAVHQSIIADAFTGKDVVVRAQKATLRILDEHAFIGGEAVQIRARSGRFEQFMDRVFGTPGQAAPMSGGA